MCKDACLDVNCGQHSKCQIEGIEAFCVCDEGWTYNPKEISAGCIGKSSFINQVLTDWFAGKNLDDTVTFKTIFITGKNQVRSITDKFIPLQSGSVFYKCAKLTSAQYKHRYIFTLDGNHKVIFTMDDC